MKNYILVALILAAITIYGCAQQTADMQPQPEPTEKQQVTSEVIPAISFTAVPAAVKEGEDISVKWKISAESPLTSMHTAVHYDKISHAGVLTAEDGPQAAGYALLTNEYASVKFSVPNEFSTKFSAPGGAEKVYLRAHIIVNGKNYWTDESVVAVEKAVVPPAPKEKEFVIEADDDGLYPSSISVKKGDEVMITFEVRSQGVYYGGLDFRGEAWGTTGKVGVGQSKSVKFTADQSFAFRSYWPASSVLKANGQVIVE